MLPSISASFGKVKRRTVLERYQEIERSIIKKYRKDIWRPFIKGIQNYDLIQEGDKIAV